jgi:hypothetical protein
LFTIRVQRGITVQCGPAPDGMAGGPVEGLSNNTLSDLIASIYDCALDPELWEGVLWRISDALGSPCNVSIGSLDLHDQRFVISKVACKIPYPLEEQNSYSCEFEYLTRMMSAHVPIGEPQIVSRHVPASYKEVSPYFREFWKKHGIADIMQCPLESSCCLNCAGRQ